MRDWRKNNRLIKDLLTEDYKEKKVSSLVSTSVASTSVDNNIKEIPIETNHQQSVENSVCAEQNLISCYSSDSDSINNLSCNYILSDEDDSIPFDIDSLDSEKLISSETDLNQNMEIENQDVITISFLRTWSLKHNIKTAPLNELLIHLNSVIPGLPRDNRTLKKTLRDVNVIKKAGGDFIYLIVASALLHYLNRTKGVKKVIEFTVNIDGVRVYTSQCKLFWPILITINQNSPYLFALWYGEIKPNNIFCYHQEFIEEMKHLLSKGYKHNNIYFPVCLIAFICDAPARAFLKGIQGHSGYNSCERCEEHGIYTQGVRLLGKSAPIRTDAKLRCGIYGLHQHKPFSSLLSLNFPMVSEFVLDYMHLICLEVVKRLLHNWERRSSIHRLNQNIIDQISAEMLHIAESTPSEFQCTARKLDDLLYFKTVEFRFIRLYSGLVVLEGKISGKEYNLFLALSIATLLLLSDIFSKQKRYVIFSKSLFYWFTNEANSLYGETFSSYNVHSQIHIADDVLNHNKTLNELSAYPFENYLGCLKKGVHSGRYAISIISGCQKIRGKLTIQ